MTTTGGVLTGTGSLSGTGNVKGNYTVTGVYNATATSAVVTGAEWSGDNTPTLTSVSATCTGTATSTKTPVTPMAQVVSDLACDADGNYSVTPVTGVTYKVGDAVVTGSANAVNTPGVVTVIAEFDSTNYELALGAQSTFPLTFTQPADCGGGDDNTDPPGNNGTLKVHEKGTLSDTESNDPIVCVFNFEGFGFDEEQEGRIVIEPQGGDSDTTDTATLDFGPTDSDGYYETEYLNDGGQSLDNGHYKSTLFGKDANGDYTIDLKAKSKVFKVDCPPQVVETPVTPVVQFLEPTCEIRTGRVVISTTTGVTYKIDGVVKTAGTYAYPASTTVTVTAEIQEGFVLDAGATAEWPPYTFAAVPTNCGNLLGLTDICPNIEGTQTVVPAGLIRNPTTGECFTPGGRGAFTPAQVLGAATALPETLPSTGGADSPLAIIIASILAYGAAYFLQGRRLLGRKEALSA